jgi:hypothetical protein
MIFIIISWNIEQSKKAPTLQSEPKDIIVAQPNEQSEVIVVDEPKSQDVIARKFLSRKSNLNDTKSPPNNQQRYTPEFVRDILADQQSVDKWFESIVGLSNSHPGEEGTKVVVDFIMSSERDDSLRERDKAMVNAIKVSSLKFLGLFDGDTEILVQGVTYDGATQIARNWYTLQPGSILTREGELETVIQGRCLEGLAARNSDGDYELVKSIHLSYKSKVDDFETRIPQTWEQRKIDIIYGISIEAMATLDYIRDHGREKYRKMSVYIDLLDSELRPYKQKYLAPHVNRQNM